MYTATFNKQGNIKLGNEAVWSFSKLAGAGEIGGCKGTCTGCCEGGCYNVDNPKKSPCYMFPIYLRYGWEHSSVVKGHIRNTKAMRASVRNTFKDLETQMNRAQKLPKVCRINVSGELQSKEELMGWIMLARRKPKVKFYVYTKNFKVLDETMSFLKRSKKEMLPDNMYILISIWHKSGIETYKKWSRCKNIKAFVYDDGYDYAAEGVKIDKMCPAYRKVNGKVKLFHDLTCDKCKLCFNDKAKIIGCLSH